MKYQKCWLLDDRSTLATYLQNPSLPHPYFTGMVGKYLNGYGDGTISDTDCRNPTYVPPGWNRWQALSGSPFDMWNYTITDNEPLPPHTVVYPNTGCPLYTCQYQTDVLGQRAVDFLHEAATTGQPFFLWVTPASPHLENTQHSADLVGDCLFNDPYGAAHGISTLPAYSTLADGVSLPTKENDYGQFILNKPAFYNELGFTQLLDETCDTSVYETQLEALKPIDNMIGTIMTTMPSAVRSKTVVVSTSDNGFYYGEHNLQDKVVPYEEGIRVPLAVHYCVGGSCQTQGHLPNFVTNSDLAPTIAELAGLCGHITNCQPQPQPCGTGNCGMDGLSLVPLLDSSIPDPTVLRTRFLVEHWIPLDPSCPPLDAGHLVCFPSYQGIRTGPTDGGGSTANLLYTEYQDSGTPNKEYYTNLPIDSMPVATELTNGWFSGCCDTLAAQLVALKDCGGGLGTGTNACQALEGYQP